MKTLSSAVIADYFDAVFRKDQKGVARLLDREERLVHVVHPRLGYTALYFAFRNRHPQLAAFLTRRGASLDEVAPSSGTSLRELAAWTGQKSLFDRLRRQRHT